MLWTPAETVDLCLDWDDFHEKHPSRTYEAYARKTRRARTGPTDEEWDSYFQEWEKLSQVRMALSPLAGGKVAIPLPGKKPVMVLHTGDWHLGHPGVDYRQLRHDLEIIAQTPGVYVFGMGDYKDNRKSGTKPATGLYQGGNPNVMDQEKHVLAMLRKIKHRLLGLVEGNHDAWDATVGGIDNFPDLCADLGVENLGHGSVVSLTLGDQRYTAGLRHNLGGRATGLARYLSDIAAHQPDWVCMGHYHFNDQRTLRVHGMATPSHLLRSGSYEVEDSYGDQTMGKHGEIGIPSVIIYPDRHLCVPYHGELFAEGVDYLQFIRRRYAA